MGQRVRSARRGTFVESHDGNPLPSRFNQQERDSDGRADARAAAYIGEYESNGIRSNVSVEQDQLFVVAPGVWLRMRLYPEGDDQFFPLDEDVDLTFVRDAHGDVTEMKVISGGQAATARRVK